VTKTAKISLSIGLIVVAVVLYVVRSGGSASDITAQTEYNALLKCRACGNEFKATLDVADQPPYTCAKCGKKEAWKLAECRKCGNIFLPRPPMIATCPKCKSQATGAVTVQ
jgi:Zn finger protein HypA/HybF involved in hydrogenase expression